MSGLCMDTLTPQQVAAVLEADTVQSQSERLCSVFNISPSDERAQILIAFHVGNIRFAQKSRFSDRVVRVFLAIMHKCLEYIIGPPQNDFTRSLEYFENLVIRHSVQRPPFSEQVFSIDQSQAIRQYVLDTIFRSFKLYKHSFTTKIELNITCPVPAPESTDGDDLENDQTNENEATTEAGERKNSDVSTKEDTESADDIYNRILGTPQGVELETIIRVALKKNLYKVEDQIKGDLAASVEQHIP